VSFKEAATELVREALDGQFEFLVLRGADEFAHQDGDLDVLVPRNQSILALLLVGEEACKAGWRIAAIGDIGYLSQICLVKRCNASGQYRAVKVDFFNGASWAALGDDPLGRAVLDIRKDNGSLEAIGLTTLLQKLLYGGHLRARDRARIAVACDHDRIEAFVTANGLPLTRADLDRGKLSSATRWRLRAASSGVRLAGMPAWIAKVVWRKLHFAVVRSTIQGWVLIVSGADSDRRAELIARYQLLLERSGFPKLAIETRSDAKGLAFTSRLLTAWRGLRGETVLVNCLHANSGAPGARWCSTALHITLPDRGSYTHDDLDVLLATVSQKALSTLREMRT